MNKELPTFIFNHLTLPKSVNEKKTAIFFPEKPKKIQSCFVYTFRLFARCLLHIKIKCRNMITNAKKKCSMRPLFPEAAISSTVIDRPAALYKIPCGLKNPHNNSTMDMFMSTDF